MGVNLVAIFPIGHFDKKIYCVLDKIRNQEYTTIQDYYKSTIFYGFPELSNLRLQWYLNDQKIKKQPKLPNSNATLELPEGLIITFRNDGIVIWSHIRASFIILEYPKIWESLKSVLLDIGKDIHTKECWIMGDNNAIYHMFLKNEDFKCAILSDLEVKTIEHLHNIDHNLNTYNLEGHYKLNIPKH